eukprot:12894299-Alexandrium_andersonii.AAC.1
MLVPRPFLPSSLGAGVLSCPCHSPPEPAQVIALALLAFSCDALPAGALPLLGGFPAEPSRSSPLTPSLTVALPAFIRVPCQDARHL